MEHKNCIVCVVNTPLTPYCCHNFAQSFHSRHSVVYICFAHTRAHKGEATANAPANCNLLFCEKTPRFVAQRVSFLCNFQQLHGLLRAFFTRRLFCAQSDSTWHIRLAAAVCCPFCDNVYQQSPHSRPFACAGSTASIRSVTQHRR